MPAAGASLPLSVVMPVRNARPFLDSSIESIVGQTFRAFEFVILDDASDDGSTEKLREWAERDPRIRLFRSDERLGPVASSQQVVDYSRAPVIARMDADDISHPERLERQLDLLTRIPEAGMVAALHDVIGRDSRMLRPADAARLLRPDHFAPFAHGSIMFRRSVFNAAGGYSTGKDFWEDIDLFRRMAAQSKVIVIPQILYRHRISSASTRQTSDWETVAASYGRLFASLASASKKRPETPAQRIAPYAFVLMESPVLWAGGRPKVLGRLLNRGALGPDKASLLVILWAAWAQASPASLRWVLGRRLALGNHRARRRLADKPWVEWAPPSPAASLDAAP